MADRRRPVAAHRPCEPLLFYVQSGSPAISDRRVIAICRNRGAEAIEPALDTDGCNRKKIENEHRFAPHLPVFLTISRDGLSMYLSQHAGDCQPGGLVFLYVPDVDALYAELTGRGIKAQSPPEDFEGRIRDFQVIDPDGNKLDFCTRLSP